MKVLRLDTDVSPVSGLERNILKDIGFSEIAEIPGRSPREIIDAGKDADIVIAISNTLSADTIKGLKKCRAIMRRGNGCDKIDVRCATENGIIVSNLPDSGTAEVADHAMLLLLALARKLPDLQKAMQSNDCMGKLRKCNILRVGGKTLGIVGFGNIGKAVAVRAKAFNINVIDYHRTVDPKIEEEYGVTPVSFHRLLRDSDFIVLTCPLTEDTRNMIGEKELRLMNPTAFLINIARGAVCDEYALAKALKEKTIAGAGIDVYEHINVFAPLEGQPECLYKDLDNVILTPHCAAFCEVKDGLRISMEQLKMIISGIFPDYCVNPEVFEILKDIYEKGKGNIADM